MAETTCVDGFSGTAWAATIGVKCSRRDVRATTPSIHTHDPPEQRALAGRPSHLLKFGIAPMGISVLSQQAQKHSTGVQEITLEFDDGLWFRLVA